MEESAYSVVRVFSRDAEQARHCGDPWVLLERGSTSPLQAVEQAPPDQTDSFRSNVAVGSFAPDLPLHTTSAGQILHRKWGSTPLPHRVAGEVAYLAAFLYAWKQAARSETHVYTFQQKGATR